MGELQMSAGHGLGSAVASLIKLFFSEEALLAQMVKNLFFFGLTPDVNQTPSGTP